MPKETDSLYNAIDQAYAMLGTTPHAEGPVDDKFDTTELHTGDDTLTNKPTLDSNMRISSDSIHFISELYSLYFLLKLIHWNTLNRSEHLTSDGVITRLLKFIDDYTETCLTTIKHDSKYVMVNKLIDIDEFFEVLSTQFNSAQLDTSDLGARTSLQLIIDKLILMLQYQKDALDDESNPRNTALITLVDDMITDMVKTTYLSNIL